ncbi:nucleoside deaminase [Parapedobacter sp. GCM10030251]|jgi:Cytosine/adenosine deaminases|uniref:nucleoside deaminase n=1 Tax=Parapedobacter sp. GCM10030251 TaxID=3273419 RepID=UPI00361BC0A0
MNRITESDLSFLKQAVELAEEGVRGNHGGPFGCLIVKGGQIIGSGYNRVLSDKDPTAHAEIVAIRSACAHLGNFQLSGCTLYTSCEPCPMCLGAIYWARPERVWYAATRMDAAAAGFDDAFIYEEIIHSINDRKIPFEFYRQEEFLAPFDTWARKVKNEHY